MQWSVRGRVAVKPMPAPTAHALAALLAGQLLFRRQEPQPPGPGAQPGEAIGEHCGIGGLDLPDQHL
jgi:hypothetical protein